MTLVKKSDPLDVRFWAKVDKTATCWNWTGGRSNGYGGIMHRRRRLLAHRLSYEMHVGPIADGLQLDHLCRNRSCVNPAHLEAVTPQVNQLRSRSVSGLNAAKTHCDHGHPLSGENLYVCRRGKRHCRTCRRAASARSDARRRGRAVA